MFGAEGKKAHAEVRVTQGSCSTAATPTSWQADAPLARHRPAAEMDEFLHQGADPIRLVAGTEAGGSFEVPIDRDQAQSKADETRFGLKELGLDDTASLL